MAVILQTGLPGTGKTSAVVVEIMRALESGRPVFCDGIKDLDLSVAPVPPVDEWCRAGRSETGADTVEWVGFAPGALVVLDECQRFFRPRASGAKVPLAVSGFETHRHFGLDFILISQHPGLLDQNIRKLVGIHRHLHDTFYGRFQLEWRGIGSPDDRSSRDVALRTRFRPPKEAFAHYTSAELHTKVPRKIPKVVFVFALSVLVIAGLGGWMFHRIDSRVSGTDKTDKTASSEHVVGVRNSSVVGVLDFADMERPRVVGLAYTAPKYDGLTKPVSVPYPAACIQSATVCRCWTDQATRLDVPVEVCRTIVAGSMYLPWVRSSSPSPESPVGVVTTSVRPEDRAQRDTPGA